MLFYSHLIICFCVLSYSRQGCIWAGKALCRMLIWSNFMRLQILGIKIIYFGIHTAVVTAICVKLPELSWITAMWQYRAQGSYVLFNQFIISPFSCTKSALALRHLAVAETELQVSTRLLHVLAVELALCQPGISSMLQECSGLRVLSTLLAAFCHALQGKPWNQTESCTHGLLLLL